LIEGFDGVLPVNYCTSVDSSKMMGADSKF